MPDYAAINRYIDNGERMLFMVNIVLTLLLGVTFFTGGIRLSYSEEPMEAAVSIRSQGDTQESVTSTEVADRTRGRAPFRTGRVVKAREVDELGAFRLVGASTRRSVKKAYVRDLKLEKMLIKEIGDQLGSYEVVEIERDGIVLRKGSEDFVLRK